MTEFFTIALSLPTAIYTGLLCVLALYWVLVIVGALDIDALHIPSFGDHGEHVGAEAMLDALGLAGVPLTIVGSVWILVSWVASVAMVEFAGSPGFALGAGIFVISSVLGLGVSKVVLHPFRGAFHKNPARDRRSLIGKVARVSSLRVDGKFGVARIEDGPDVFEIHVRCPEANRLGQGAKVLVIDFDPKEETFRVVPASEALPPGLLDD